MILSDIFQRFVQDSPLTVMTQAILENALPPATIDELFEEYADWQYTRKLLFSDVVDLMSMVVCSIRPSINSAFKKLAPTLGVTRKAVYDKINRVETSTSAALVRHTGTVLTPIIDELGAREEPLLVGYRTRVLDGNHLAGTEHRLEVLRTTGSAPLPGQSLVVLDPELRLVVDVIPCEDGHAQERSLTDEIFALVRPRDLWIADRNFCTTQLLYGIAGREAFFIIRQHARNLHWEFVGKRGTRPDQTGQVFEQRSGRPTMRESSCSCDGSRSSWTSRHATEILKSTCSPTCRARTRAPGDRRLVPQTLDHRDRLPRTGGGAPK